MKFHIGQIVPGGRRVGKFDFFLIATGRSRGNSFLNIFRQQDVIPGNPIYYAKLVDGVLQEIIGNSGITITRVSGVDASDLVITVAGATSYGIAELTEYTWVEFQDLCLASGFIFAARKGCLVYSVDESSIGAKIISWLGGLYVVVDEGWIDINGAVWADELGSIWA